MYNTLKNVHLYKNSYYKHFNPLYLGNPEMRTFANSEDSYEMQHNAAFHQGLHLCKGKKILGQKNMIFFENYNPTPLDIYYAHQV